MRALRMQDECLLHKQTMCAQAQEQRIELHAVMMTCFEAVPRERSDALNREISTSCALILSSARRTSASRCCEDRLASAASVSCALTAATLLVSTFVSLATPCVQKCPQNLCLWAGVWELA